MIEALTCPFCGAPYRETIPAGTVQVKCQYCGAIILVPPSLGGVVRQCLNHPETLAVGLCNDCSQSFCTRCLYVLNVQGGRLYVCAKCYENRTAKGKIAAVLSFVLALIFLAAIPFLMASPAASSDIGGVFRILFYAILLLAISAVGLFIKPKSPPSLYDMMSKGAYMHTPKSFLKKCVKCEREIPIASEKCPYCQARQPEYEA